MKIFEEAKFPEKSYFAPVCIARKNCANKRRQKLFKQGNIFCQFIYGDNGADSNNCQVRNLDLNIPTKNSNSEIGNFDEDYISSKMNPVDKDADLDEFKHFSATIERQIQASETFNPF